MRRVFASAVIGFACAGAYSTSLSAQSLAEAARRAEEAHKANEGIHVPSFSDSTLRVDPLQGFAEALNVELTMANVRKWLPQRTNMLKAMADNPPLAARVQMAMRTSRTVADLEAAYNGEPMIVEGLRTGGTTAHDYTLTQMALAMAAAALSKAAMDPAAKFPGKVGTNVQFLRQNARDLAAPFQLLATLEAQVERIAAAQK